MSDAKHSPTPWREEDEGDRSFIVDANGNHVAAVFGEYIDTRGAYGRTKRERKKNGVYREQPVEINRPLIVAAVNHYVDAKPLADQIIQTLMEIHDVNVECVICEDVGGRHEKHCGLAEAYELARKYQAVKGETP